MAKTKPKSQTYSTASKASMSGEGEVLKVRAERLRGRQADLHHLSRWQILLKDTSTPPVPSQGFAPSFIDLPELYVAYLENCAKNASQLA